MGPEAKDQSISDAVRRRRQRSQLLSDKIEAKKVELDMATVAEAPQESLLSSEEAEPVLPESKAVADPEAQVPAFAQADEGVAPEDSFHAAEEKAEAEQPVEDALNAVHAAICEANEEDEIEEITQDSEPIAKEEEDFPELREWLGESLDIAALPKTQPSRVASKTKKKGKHSPKEAHLDEIDSPNAKKAASLAAQKQKSPSSLDNFFEGF